MEENKELRKTISEFRNDHNKKLLKEEVRSGTPAMISPLKDEINQDILKKVTKINHETKNEKKKR